MQAIKQPQTLQEAMVYYSDPQQAFEAAISLREIVPSVQPREHPSPIPFSQNRKNWLLSFLPPYDF